MTLILCGALLVCGAAAVRAEPAASYSFNYANDVVKDDYFQQPVHIMAPKKTPHSKAESGVFSRPLTDSWAPLDIGKYDNSAAEVMDHNRLKRRVKQQRKRGRSQRRRGGRPRSNAAPAPDDEPHNVSSASAVPVARRSDADYRQKKAKGKGHSGHTFDAYDPPIKDWESSFVEMPKDLYQAHLRPGVIFRIHMSEAILKMQYRAYGEDKDESVIEADVEYLRLTRKVVNDEITKFEDLRWLVGWFSNRSDLITEHTCNTRYLSVGTPPTMFTHSEEYMKRLCLFDNVYIDHIPYVIGEDSSLMAAVAPPVLHCDASTCTSVPFIDSVMFDEKLARTNVRTVTRCQASCRAHCRNDPDCLKRCSDRCAHGD